jgi:hypothetical protein
MSCSDLSHRVRNDPLSSDEIAQPADLLPFPMWAGCTIHFPEHSAVASTRTSTAVKAVSV